MTGAPAPVAWRPVFAATAALLVGTGLARFAYAPLIPALVAGRWFTPAAADYLGAANLAGYLLGALLASHVALWCGARRSLQAAMAVATLAFFACAMPLSFTWMALWRLAAGFAGAVLMVLAAPLVLPYVPGERRGLAGGIILAGVGLGIALSGTLVPLLLHGGLVAAWCGLGAVATVLTLFAWTGWPAAAVRHDRAMRHRPDRVLWWIAAEYALNAAGLVPHMLFLVDFIARSRGAGIAAGAFYWVLLGTGALVGPVVIGRIADRIGFATALRAAYAVEAVGVAALALSDARAVLVASSLVVGAFIPGITTLMLGRVRELTPATLGAQHVAWGLATTAFAVGMATAAYGFAYLYAREGSYALLFALGAASLVAALAIDVGVIRRPFSPSRPR